MTAGLQTLEWISVPSFFDTLSAKVETLVNGIMEKAKAAGEVFEEIR